MTPARRIRRIQRWQRAPKQFVVDRVVLLACFVHHSPWRREDGAKHTRFRERCVTADSLMVAELAWLCEYSGELQKSLEYTHTELDRARGIIWDHASDWGLP